MRGLNRRDPGAAANVDVAWRPVRGFVDGVERLFPEKLIGYLA
jgi:hypothetical protein